MEKDNRYTKMQESFYSRGTSNHQEHNANTDYWDLLLGGIDSMNGLALDFGCGKGRNVSNMIDKGNFERVDGIDISQNNINHCTSTLTNSKFYKNNGVDLSDIESDTYDFVMSTIVLQHIPVYDIRLSLLTEIHRVMKDGGTFSFQMGYGDDLVNPNGNDRIAYHDNHYGASGTNGILDVRVTNKDDLIKDLESIGFTVNNVEIKDSFSDVGHPKWIYVSCKK
jgi:SAM-dependent methyltransferase